MMVTLIESQIKIQSLPIILNPIIQLNLKSFSIYHLNTPTTNGFPYPLTPLKPSLSNPVLYHLSRSTPQLLRMFKSILSPFLTDYIKDKRKNMIKSAL